MMKQENDNLVMQKILKEMKNNDNVTDTQLINVFGYTIEHVKMARDLWLKKRCGKNASLLGHVDNEQY